MLQLLHLLFFEKQLLVLSGVQEGPRVSDRLQVGIVSVWQSLHQVVGLLGILVVRLHHHLVSRMVFRLRGRRVVILALVFVVVDDIANYSSIRLRTCSLIVAMDVLGAYDVIVGVRVVRE